MRRARQNQSSEDKKKRMSEKKGRMIQEACQSSRLYAIFGQVSVLKNCGYRSVAGSKGCDRRPWEVLKSRIIGVQWLSGKRLKL